MIYDPQIFKLRTESRINLKIEYMHSIAVSILFTLHYIIFYKIKKLILRKKEKEKKYYVTIDLDKTQSIYLKIECRVQLER